MEEGNPCLAGAVGVFSVAATVDQVRWVQAAGLLVAALSFVRVLLTPVGVGALEILAPIAFLALVLILSVRLLIGRGTPMSTKAPVR